MNLGLGVRAEEDPFAMADPSFEQGASAAKRNLMASWYLLRRKDGPCSLS
jgi:hypothetical protein